MSDRVLTLEDSKKFDELFKNESIISDPFGPSRKNHSETKLYYSLTNRRLGNSYLLRVSIDRINDMMAYTLYNAQKVEEKPTPISRDWTHGSSYSEICMLLKNFAAQFFFTSNDMEYGLSEISQCIFEELMKG